ncbi:MAG: hypothetical protein LUD47_03180 [Clostridia bacterium]|nr:hypothetical protein [Clostridia bacterium]
MNLLFFDIECASVTARSARICAFGYVLCDTSFNIIKKEDILINPMSGFHLTDNKGEKGLVLPYPRSQFKKSPSFYSVYRRIKYLLESRDNVVIGHAIQNDVKYLNLERLNLRLPPFDFNFYDTQLLYMTEKNDFSHQIGLGEIADGLDVEYTPHRALDDAYATMKIAEAMAKSYGGSVDKMFSALRATPGHIHANEIVPPATVAQTKYLKEHSEQKEQRSKNRVAFFQFLCRKKKKKGQWKLSGKVFNFSRLIEDDLERAEDLVNFIYENGGTYTQKTADCNIYVCGEGDDTERTKTAKEMNVRIIAPEGIRGLTDDV